MSDPNNRKPRGMMRRYLLLLPLLALGLLGIVGSGGGGGAAPPPPPSGSSNWDSLIWDQGNWS